MIYRTALKLIAFFIKDKLMKGYLIGNDNITRVQIGIVNLFWFLSSFYFLLISTINLFNDHFKLAVLGYIDFFVILFVHIIFRITKNIKLYRFLFSTLITLAICQAILLYAMHGSGFIGANIVILAIMYITGVCYGSLLVFIILLTEFITYFFGSTFSWIYELSELDKILFIRYICVQIGTYLFSLLALLNQSNQYKDLLREKEQKKQLFINIVHDLKTPLTIIRNNIEKCSDENKNLKSLSLLKDNILNMEQNIINILNLNRLENNIVTHKKIEIANISLLTIEICNLFKPYAESKEIEIRTEIEPQLSAIIDQISYLEILNNLLDNAIKYTNKKGSIKVSLRSFPTNIQLEVKDTGIGISDEEIENIFDSYYQANRRMGQFYGLGLGLAIIKEICNAYNGGISVDSVVGMGSCFTVKLPKSFKKGNFQPINSAKSFIPSTSFKELTKNEHDNRLKTILILEDNINIRNLLIENFQYEYNLLIADDGLKGLSMCNSNKNIDLIITDIMMPNMDGKEFIKRIQGDESKRKIPIILLTAKSEPNDAIHFLSLGAVDYISKPFSIKELKIKVESLLSTFEHNENYIKKKIKAQIKNYLTNNLVNKNSQTPQIDNRLFQKFVDYNISPKEQIIISEIAKGLCYKEIAYNQNISINTVKSHVHRIYKKCNVINSAGLIKLFYDYGEKIEE